MAKVVTPFTSRTQPLALLIVQLSADQPVKSNETLTVGDDGKMTVTMGSIIEILWPSDTLGDAAVPLHQKIQRVLVKATEQAKAGSATGAVLKQFEGNMSRLPNVQSVYSSRKLAPYWVKVCCAVSFYSRCRRSFSRSSALHLDVPAATWCCVEDSRL